LSHWPAFSFAQGQTSNKIRVIDVSLRGRLGFLISAVVRVGVFSSTREFVTGEIGDLLGNFQIF
jgi:hypothetical protein